MSESEVQVLMQMVASIGSEVRNLRAEAVDERRLLSDKIEKLMQNGCAKAGDHNEIGKQGERITVLEMARARNLGIISVAMVALGVALEIIREVCVSYFRKGG